MLHHSGLLAPVILVMKLAQSSTVIIHPTVSIVPASKEESNRYNQFKWYSNF